MAQLEEVLGIGLIGLGIGQQHLLGYQRKGIHVAAICDIDEARLQNTAEKFGVEKTYTRADALIADPDVHIVDIALQPWLRWPVVAAAAESGKHVLSQKPFAMSMRQAVGMVEVCEEHGVRLMVNQNSCFVPGFLAIEPYMTSEYLGTIYHVSITCDGWFTVFPERHLITGMMVHHVALLHKWFGEFDNVFCQAHGHTQSIEAGETVVIAQLKTRSGIQVLLSCNWAVSGRAGHTHRHPHEEIRIQGTHGSICGHSEDMTIHVTEPHDVEIKPTIRGTWFPDAFGNAGEYFIGCIRAGEKPITDGRGNLHVLQTCFAMYESARTGKIVAVEDISLDSDYNMSPGRVLGPDEPL